MGGLMFFAVIGLWIYFLKWLVNAFDSRMPKPPWRQVVKVLLFAVLFPLPLLDEIVGGRQFAKLCEANVVTVNRDTARGRTIYAEAGSFETLVSGTWVKVWMMPFRYLDATTGEVVVSFNHLRAEGGHLFPGFDSGPDPLTFRGSCKPSGIPDQNFYRDLKLVIVERPRSK